MIVVQTNTEKISKLVAGIDTNAKSMIGKGKDSKFVHTLGESFKIR